MEIKLTYEIIFINIDNLITLRNKYANSIYRWRFKINLVK